MIREYEARKNETVYLSGGKKMRMYSRVLCATAAHGKGVLEPDKKESVAASGGRPWAQSHTVAKEGKIIQVGVNVLCSSK
jgi:hypothetical protein